MRIYWKNVAVYHTPIFLRPALRYRQYRRMSSSRPYYMGEPYLAAMFGDHALEVRQYVHLDRLVPPFSFSCAMAVERFIRNDW